MGNKLQEIELRISNISVAWKGTIGKQLLEMLGNLSDNCSLPDASCLPGRGFSQKDEVRAGMHFDIGRDAVASGSATRSEVPHFRTLTEIAEAANPENKIRLLRRTKDS